MHLRGPRPRVTSLAFAGLLASAIASHAAPAPNTPAAPLLDRAAAPSSSAPTTGPRLIVEAQLHDFGIVQKGVKLRHAFTLRNAGTQPLEIKNVQTSCGCTTAGEWTRMIAPGASGTIPVEFDSAQFSGPITKSITVTSTCALRATTVLEIKADVRTPVTVSQPLVIFAAATDPSKSDTRSVTIRHAAEGSLQLSAPSSDHPAFAPSLKEVVPGREFELQLRTVPPLETGTHTGRISLRTSHPDVPLVTVQAVVTILPPVQITPASITLPPRKTTAPEKRFVALLNHRGGELELSDLETNAPGLTFAPRRSPDGRQITITFTFPAGFEHPAEKLYFRGKTNHPALPTFEVPFVFTGSH